MERQNGLLLAADSAETHAGFDGSGIPFESNRAFDISTNGANVS
ncbi:hypothetical protein BLA18109_01972 [Burkholderia lata]|uniref:Uncharacterized protein n=1 Tax=Burkholderia lata (strain ATCC 17760 / DSM 23089 / LMG 22485 / NCIMB 9086 / R18194 / 383) TaxID=482957 RepID=A0A6P2TPB0_BURL3|nr:hypothetical protein BLA18109_01972 [Burkholderia lata]